MRLPTRVVTVTSHVMEVTTLRPRADACPLPSGVHVAASLRLDALPIAVSGALASNILRGAPVTDARPTPLQSPRAVQDEVFPAGT